MTEQEPRRPKGIGSIYERGGVVIGQYEVQTPWATMKREYIRARINAPGGVPLATRSALPETLVARWGF